MAEIDRMQDLQFFIESQHSALELVSLEESKSSAEGSIQNIAQQTIKYRMQMSDSFSKQMVQTFFEIFIFVEKNCVVE